MVLDALQILTSLSNSLDLCFSVKSSAHGTGRVGTVSLWNLPFVRGSCRLAQELEKQSVGPLALAAGWRPEGGGGSLLRVLGRPGGTRRFRRGRGPGVSGQHADYGHERRFVLRMLSAPGLRVT